MRARVTACAVLAVAALLSVAAADGSGSRVISGTGTVGPLRMDVSSRAQVIAFAGKPDAEGHGQYNQHRYDVLGYGCKDGAVTRKHWQQYVVGCRTGFYLVGGKLGLFFTYDKRYEEAHGVWLGMRTVRAEQRLHVRATGGCTTAIRVGLLVIPANKGRVYAFFLHSRHHDPGVTDCD